MDEVKKPRAQSSGMKSGGAKGGNKRSAARLGAVQALYQIEMTEASAAAVVVEYVKHRLGQEIDGDKFVPADATLFEELVQGAVRQQAELDGIIQPALSAEWPLDRLEMILRAILRVATFELAHRIDVPVRVVITEYVDIAHAFFTGKEPGLINGVLDRLGRQLRPTEWA
ncbi:N utilization substance protein B [Aliidongia dinghuensis]|uniref:Transcription antitermination protein NusB n=1 Tax=Aliidongia dinghuensis TaxID=1867774 RepID=A0A8J2YXF7_9PROT|nr:transcription antitermination factor NusB [Aliidongia dinghuensis]GGF28592.1 N utilization substance protein B [Aliidongia dinghuensis]